MKEPARRYAESQILTAPREELLLLLLDGAIRFTEQAMPPLRDRDREAAGALLMRAQRVVAELLTTLKPDLVGEAVYASVTGLYTFVYFRLVNANVRGEPALAEEALRVLRHLRETWAMAIEKDRREKFPEVKLLEQAQQSSPPAAGSVNLNG